MSRVSLFCATLLRQREFYIFIDRGYFFFLFSIEARSKWKVLDPEFISYQLRDKPRGVTLRNEFAEAFRKSCHCRAC